MRETLEYWLVLIVARALGAMPRGLARLVAGMLAFLVYWAFGRLHSSRRLSQPGVATG
jgi:hypothetical protein